MFLKGLTQRQLQLCSQSADEVGNKEHFLSGRHYLSPTKSVDKAGRRQMTLYKENMYCIYQKCPQRWFFHVSTFFAFLFVIQILGLEK